MHTQEELDALALKSDVVAVAEELGLATSGTRKEITARILDSQTVVTDVDEPEDHANTAADPDLAAEVEKQQAEAVKIVEEEVKSDTPLVAFTAQARRAVELTVGSYIGADAIKSEIKQIMAALEAGLQVLVAEGAGNVRFAVRVSETPFSVSDVSTDIQARRDGVILNLCRFLADKNLYPRG